MQYYDMIEKKQHGTPEFPMRYSCSDPYEHPYQFVMHWHKGYEINLIQAGSMTLTINDSRYECETGDLIFIPAGALHSAIQRDCSHDCLVFEMEPFTKGYEESAEFYRKILSGELVIGPVIPSSEKEICEITGKLMVTLKNAEKGYQEMTIGLLRYLFGMVYAKGYYHTNTVENMQFNAKTVKLKKVLSYIQEHFTENVLLEELSAQADMSEKYFCEFFKKMTGQTPIEYVNCERLMYARKELLTTEHSITYIAFSSGFNDVSYFIRLFRKAFGSAPGKYRKKYNPEESMQPEN